MRGEIREEKTVNERRNQRGDRVNERRNQKGGDREERRVRGMSGGERGAGGEERGREDVKVGEKRGKQRRRRRSMCVFRVRAAIQTNSRLLFTHSRSEEGAPPAGPPTPLKSS